MCGQPSVRTRQSARTEGEPSSPKVPFTISETSPYPRPLGQWNDSQIHQSPRCTRSATLFGLEWSSSMDNLMESNSPAWSVPVQWWESGIFSTSGCLRNIKSLAKCSYLSIMEERCEICPPWPTEGLDAWPLLRHAILLGGLYSS